MNTLKMSFSVLYFILVGFTALFAQNANSLKSYQNENGISISQIIDTPPKFPGDVNKYLSDSIRYPEEAREKNIQGTVYVYCVIEKDGSVSHVKILRSDNAVLNKEAMRVVSTMPKWMPAKEKGIPQRIEYSIAVNFKL